MSSGLYALPGASAAATAAACANRLDEPMTKVSKTYFGFNRVSTALEPGRAPNGFELAPSRWRLVEESGKVSVDLSTLRGDLARSPARSGAWPRPRPSTSSAERTG